MPPSAIPIEFAPFISLDPNPKAPSLRRRHRSPNPPARVPDPPEEDGDELLDYDDDELEEDLPDQLAVDCLTLQLYDECHEGRIVSAMYREHFAFHIIGVTLVALTFLMNQWIMPPFAGPSWKVHFISSVCLVIVRIFLHMDSDHKRAVERARRFSVLPAIYMCFLTPIVNLMCWKTAAERTLQVPIDSELLVFLGIMCCARFTLISAMICTSCFSFGTQLLVAACLIFHAAGGYMNPLLSRTNSTMAVSIGTVTGLALSRLFEWSYRASYIIAVRARGAAHSHTHKLRARAPRHTLAPPTRPSVTHADHAAAPRATAPRRPAPRRFLRRFLRRRLASTPPGGNSRECRHRPLRTSAQMRDGSFRTMQLTGSPHEQQQQQQQQRQQQRQRQQHQQPESVAVGLARAWVLTKAPCYSWPVWEYTYLLASGHSGHAGHSVGKSFLHVSAHHAQPSFDSGQIRTGRHVGGAIW